MSKELLEEWTSIGISLLVYARDQRNQLNNSANIEIEGVPLTEFDEILLDVQKAKQSTYVNAGFELITELDVPNEEDINGVELTDEEII